MGRLDQGDVRESLALSPNPIGRQGYRPSGLGFGAQGLGFRVYGFGAQGLGLRFGAQGLGFIRFWGPGFGFRVWGPGFSVDVPVPDLCQSISHQGE